MPPSSTSTSTSTPGAVDDRFPPHVLRDYALIADGQRGALVGPGGDITWLCAPSWDSDAVFSTLIGGGGLYAVTPIDGHSVWGGYYEPCSLVWRSRWVTSTGIIECREALAYPADAHTVVILRQVVAVRGRAEVRVVLDARAGFGTQRMSHHHDASGTWTARTGDLRLRWSGVAGARAGRAGALVAELTVEEGAHADLVLEITDGQLADRPVDPVAAWEATESVWKASVSRSTPSIADRDVAHAHAVLRGLTSAGGGMVAAATMSLPERADAGRNYDYRFAWIRDQCYAGTSAALVGAHDLLDGAVQFIAARLLDDGPQLKPAYRTDGGPVPDERRLTHLLGYPGGSDKVGNWVNQQFQLDAFGESLVLFAAASTHDRLDTGHWRAVEAAVAAIEARWHDPDAGIWELDDQRWTHSRLTCVAGLRAIAPHASGAQAARWASLADVILADASADCVHPSGRWQRSPGDPRVDAALLLPSIRDGIPPGDPRTIATVAAVRTELGRDGFVYRFRQDDRPLHDAEGAFLLCGFLMALATHQEGRPVEAVTWFERARSACGPSGLLTEEWDVGERQSRGNVPQAFVHALLVETAVRLAADIDAPT